MLYMRKSYTNEQDGSSPPALTQKLTARNQRPLHPKAELRSALQDAARSREASETPPGLGARAPVPLSHESVGVARRQRRAFQAPRTADFQPLTFWVRMSRLPPPSPPLRGGEGANSCTAYHDQK